MFAFFCLATGLTVLRLASGDTLFIGGCGRFFEGDARDMLRNMELIASLNPNTLLYVGHEYTVQNLK